MIMKRMKKAKINVDGTEFYIDPQLRGLTDKDGTGKATFNEIIIEGTRFVIDLPRNALFQVTDVNNRIYFNAMKNEGGFYTLDFDLRTKNKVKGDGTVTTPGSLFRKVTIPAHWLSGKMKYDPDYAAAMNVASYAQGWGVLLIDKDIAKRLADKLPEADLAGSRFVINVQGGKLVLKSDNRKALDFEKMYWNGLNDRVFFYDTLKAKIVRFSPKLYDLPKHIVYAALPNDYTLDPIGVARRNKVEETQYLLTHPAKSRINISGNPLSGPLLKEFERKYINQSAVKAKSIRRSQKISG